MTFDLRMKWSAVAALATVMILFFAAAQTKSAPAAPAAGNANTNSLSPGPNDARIAFIVAQLMEDYQYSQHQFDRSISEKFFDEYLATLDPRRENFLQSDVDQFSHYRTNLDIYTMGSGSLADLEPAYVIYERFRERITQHAAYVDNLLRQDQLNFNDDDTVALDRRHAPWPKDLAEAQRLWRDRARYEFLQEKMDREISPTNENVILPLSKTNLADIAAQLERHYDWTLLMLTNWDSDNILSAYLGALVHAYDPHTDYLNDANGQNFSIEMSLSLFGIGAQLSEQDGYCTIDSLVAGGPADQSKQLHPQDKIIAVAQSNQPPVNVVDVELTKVVGMIRGPKGTQVRLTIQPAEDSTVRRVVTLTREEIKLEDSKAKARLIETPDGRGETNRIGVIDVPSFYAPISLPGDETPSAQNFVSDDVAKLIKKLEQEKVQGIILDMRNDPGGSLEEAVRFTGLFVTNGPVVQARDSTGSVTVYSNTASNVVYSGPLVVLANRLSASASEIVAGALQDYGRAVIVGDTSTFGKGTVQNLTPLRPFVWPATPTATNDPGTLKITIRKFYRVSGASTQFKGVASDIVLPDVLNYSPDIGEAALDNPLPWDTNSPAHYDKLQLVQPYLNELRLRSEARTETNQDFIYIRQDIDEFKKLEAEKTETLNEQEALKERQQNAEKDKARDDERAHRPIPNEEIYDITVENADDPGLPAPEGLTTTNFVNTGAVFELSTNASTKTVSRTPKTIENAIMTNAQTEKIVNIAPVDPALDETERILEDYISLLSSNQVLIAN